MLRRIFFSMQTAPKHFDHLTAGRWFAASSLNGPWTFATPTLPKDFENIPADSPVGDVLASVPGTGEAKDAVLLAQVPTTMVVDPAAAAAQAKVTYSGDPHSNRLKELPLLRSKHAGQGHQGWRRLLPVLAGRVVPVQYAPRALAHRAFCTPGDLYDSAKFTRVQRDVRNPNNDSQRKRPV